MRWLCAVVLALPSIAWAQGESAPPGPTPSQPAPTGSAGPLLPPAAPSPPPSQAAAPSPPTVKPASASGDKADGSGSTAATATSPAQETGHFEFGSYGRVQVASDGRGGTGRAANVVAHGTRIDEDSYAELELRREDTFAGDIQNRVVATVALFPPFFHFSGDPTQAIGLRNLYSQASWDRYNLWIGSRMYRGDDIYLLDWWPLDNQNTLGGGGGVNLPGDTMVALHAGMQRLDNVYQFQTIPSPIPFGIGATQVTHLDRPRIVETLKITHFFRNNADHHYFDSDKRGFKAILYGEAHEISAGLQRNTDTNLDKPLPSDTGFLVGGELAYWTGERDTFVQLFVRHARGLAAYDPLEEPQTFANDLTTAGSTETLVALGGNWESGFVGLLVGGYVRFFRDGDPSPTTTQKYDEGTLVLRPQMYIGDHWGVALEGSYQAKRFAILDPETDEPLTAVLWRGGIMPYFSPSGRGSYKRPQYRLIYAVTSRNSAARELYPPDDVFSQRKVEHYVGLGVEWWFNSSSYP